MWIKLWRISSVTGTGLQSIKPFSKQVWTGIGALTGMGGAAVGRWGGKERIKFYGGNHVNLNVLAILRGA